MAIKMETEPVFGITIKMLLQHENGVSVFACTHREALCDGNFNVKKKNSGSESSTGSNRLLGITEHTANTGRRH